MQMIRRPFWLNAMRELRQPLAALACLLVVVNLATATAAAHLDTPWAQLCIGSGTEDQNGDMPPTSTCQHCCVVVQAQVGSAGIAIEAFSITSAVKLQAPVAFPLIGRHDTKLFGPRGPPVRV